MAWAFGWLTMLTTIFLAALGLGEAQAGEAGVAGQPAAALPGRLLLHMEPAVIVDASGFERPMAASTLFIPRGWQSEGGVFWGREYACTNGYAFQWTARSPDGQHWVAVLPNERWEWNNYGAAPSSPGCQIWPIASRNHVRLGTVSNPGPGRSSRDAPSS